MWSGYVICHFFFIFLFFYLSIYLRCVAHRTLGFLVLQGLVGHSTIPSRECLSHGFLLSYFSFSFSDPEHWGVAIHQGWWRLLVYRLDYILETIEVVGPFTVGAMIGVVQPQVKVVALGCRSDGLLQLTWAFSGCDVVVHFRWFFCVLEVGTYTFLLRPGAYFKIAHRYVGSCNRLFSVLST